MRPPRREFMVLSGMMVGKADIPPLLRPFHSLGNFVHVSRLLARQALDRIKHPRGTRLIMGNALVARLLFGLKQQRVAIRYHTQLRELIEDDGRIVGAVFTTSDGDVRIRARRGVVLASGGIGWSKELRGRLFPEGTQRYSMSPDSNAATVATIAMPTTPCRARAEPTPRGTISSSLRAGRPSHLQLVRSHPGRGWGKCRT